MSRTDAHKPFWVEAQWWAPFHSRCGRAREGVLRPCLIPDEPTYANPSMLRLAVKVRLHRWCGWEPVRPAYGPRSVYWNRVPASYRQRLHRRDRAAERDVLRNALRLFNSGLEDESFDPACPWRRHDAQREWEWYR